jgi:RNA polymerase sigma factor (sigma-70 family)
MLMSEDRTVSLLASDQYRREVMQIEPLALEEEMSLLQWVVRGNRERQQRQPDEQVLERARRARAVLVEVYQPWVVRLAWKVLYVWELQRGCRWIEWLDLVNEGNVALLQKLDQIQECGEAPDQMRRFLLTRVRYAMCSVAWSFAAVVEVTEKDQVGLRAVEQAEQAYKEQHGRLPTPEALCGEVVINGKVASVQRLYGLFQLRQLVQQVESVQALVEEDERGEEYCSFVGFYQEAQQQDTVRRQVLEEALEQARQAVLSMREDRVLALRYGLGEACHTQARIAEVMGMHTNSVRRIEDRARLKLQAALAPLYGEVQQKAAM